MNYCLTLMFSDPACLRLRCCVLHFSRVSTSIHVSLHPSYHKHGASAMFQLCFSRYSSGLLVLFEALNSHAVNVFSRIYDHQSRLDYYLEVKCECYGCCCCLVGARGEINCSSFLTQRISCLPPQSGQLSMIISGLEVSLAFNNQRKKAN